MLALYRRPSNNSIQLRNMYVCLFLCRVSVSCVLCLCLCLCLCWEEVALTLFLFCRHCHELVGHAE